MLSAEARLPTARRAERSRRCPRRPRDEVQRQAENRPCAARRGPAVHDRVRDARPVEPAQEVRDARAVGRHPVGHPGVREVERPEAFGLDAPAHLVILAREQRAPQFPEVRREAADLREHLPPHGKVCAEQRSRAELGRLASVVEQGDRRAQPGMPLARAPYPPRYAGLPSWRHRAADKRHAGIGHRGADRPRASRGRR